MAAGTPPQPGGDPASQFAADYTPINFVVLSFVGRAASEYRRREFQVALEHARTTTGLTFSAIKIVHERLAGEAKQTPSWGWVPTPSSTIQLRLSVKLKRQASQRSATSRISGRADLPTRLRTLGGTSSPGIDFSFRRQGACTHRSTSRSSIGLHPSCPPIGYFDSLSLQAVKTVALRGTASLQLQAFDLQTNSQYSLATSLDKAP